MVVQPSYEKKDNGFIVGISIEDSVHLTEVGKLVEKGDAYNMKTFYDGRNHYYVKEKLTQ